MLQPLSSPSSADLDLDAGLESFSLTQGVVGIYRDGERLWTSPAEWDVAQAQVSDLNHDGQAELALLVWRKYAAWPVDAYMAYPGRIRDFHDQDGLSCHFILIGWRHGAFRELWAGSALARPLLAFRALDVNGDGRQELLVLESHYDAQQRIADSVALWEWNGFGFSLLTRTPQRVYPSIVAARSPDGEVHILLQTRSWR
ncbi:MAG TPA: hypothetical protein VJ123_04275 [Anaerolineales bacterium]|nr:hypothetical protein [Anaerolineales bacterium]